jgi:hypothetical protein
VNEPERAVGKPICSRHFSGGLPVCWDTDNLPAGAHKAADFLDALGRTLAQNGLEVREFHYNDVLVEVGASKPGKPDRGEFSIGYDGFLIWELQGPFGGTAAVAEITNMISTILGTD